MDLTNDPIPGLVRKIAVPASVGIFFNTMYTLVDTFCAGFISTEALAALSICFPVLLLASPCFHCFPLLLLASFASLWEKRKEGAAK